MRDERLFRRSTAACQLLQVLTQVSGVPLPSRAILQPVVLRILAFVLLAAAGLTSASGDTPDGIPRELGRERAAEISNVRYSLWFELVPHAAATAGTEQIRFQLAARQSVLLDFRDGTRRKRAVSDLD